MPNWRAVSFSFFGQWYLWFTLFNNPSSFSCVEGNPCCRNAWKLVKTVHLDFHMLYIVLFSFFGVAWDILQYMHYAGIVDVDPEC